MSAAAPPRVSGRGVWFTGPREVEVRQETVAEPGAGEVLIEGERSLVSSGTELNIYRAEIGTAEEVALPTTRGRFPFPLQYGYQVVGRVAAAGEGVDLTAGQRVFAVHPHQDLFVMPVLSPADGSRRLVTPLPDDLSSDRAAFANLFAVALNGLLDAPVRHGDVVVVSGLGTVGMFAGFLARATAGRLVLSDPLTSRRTRASWIGADAVVAPDDVAEVVADLSRGRGADLHVEASGSPAALQGALRTTGVEGTVLVLSYFGTREVRLELSPEFHYRRQRIVSSMVGRVGSGLEPRWDRERRTTVAYDLLRGLDIEPLLSHRLPLHRAAEAYRLLDQEPELTQAVMLEHDRHG